MTVIEIKEIERKDAPIYYRRVYEGRAVVEAVGKTSDSRITWKIETSPLGMKETVVKMIDSIDYPLIPLLKELKKKIEYLDSEGKLPL
jgi:translation initiation factor 1 (eIF-1/SUI1)